MFCVESECNILQALVYFRTTFENAYKMHVDCVCCLFVVYFFMPHLFSMSGINSDLIIHLEVTCNSLAAVMGTACLRVY